MLTCQIDLAQLVQQTTPIDTADLIKRDARLTAEDRPKSPWVLCRCDGSRIEGIKNGFPACARDAGLSDVYPHDLHRTLGSLATACRGAGIPDLRVHDLRQTSAALLVTEGVLLMEVRDLLGHGRPQMTERYAHLAPKSVRSAVDRLADAVPHDTGDLCEKTALQVTLSSHVLLETERRT